MMKKGYTRVLSLALVLALLAGLLCLPASAAGVPEKTNNKGAYDYVDRNSQSCIGSYLYEGEDGNLVRVEALEDGSVVEVYDKDYHLLTSRKIPQELVYFAGFYHGENYNFIVYGQDNPAEDDNTEVIRITKYSKNWDRLGAASLKGANTKLPFRSGSLRMTECNGMLYVLTSHQMYKTDDGLNHQANLQLAVRESDMVITDSYYDIYNIIVGYVSHSFDQFIFADSHSRLVSLNLGDGYPRGPVIYQYPEDAGEEKVIGYGKNKVILSCTGGTGENFTGVSLGGIAESQSCYITALVTLTQDDNFRSHKDYNVYVLANDPTTLEQVNMTKLTNYTDNSEKRVSTPHLVQISPNRFAVLWQVKTKESYYMVDGTTVWYAIVDGQENVVSSPREVPGLLSDCSPVVRGNQIVWYVTEDSAPVFYALNPERGTIQKRNSDPTASSFGDVASGNWAFPYVEEAAGNGWVNGTGDGKFSPQQVLSNAEFAALLVRYLYPVEAASMGGANPWYTPYMNKMSQEGLWSGSSVSSDAGAATKPMTRYDMAQVTYNVLKNCNALPGAGEISAAKSAIPDFASVPAGYQEAVAACYAAKILNGTDERGTFNGTKTMTRDQVAKVICTVADILKLDEGGAAPAAGSSTPTITQEDLLSGYWESLIQSNKYYRFYADGTAKEYDLESALFFSCDLKYRLNGSELVLEFDGYDTVLNVVTTDSNIDWDIGLSNQLSEIPKGTPFFYETGWHNTTPNAYYLRKSDLSLDTEIR